MRAPFQILGIPYKWEKGKIFYCVFRRVDSDIWQFIAGGGEDNETSMAAAKREIFEESGVITDDVIALKSMCYIPSNIYQMEHRMGWDADLYVLPEYSFAFECAGEIKLSHEHTEYVWLSFDDALELLRYDSNRTALYELNCILTGYLNY